MSLEKDYKRADFNAHTRKEKAFIFKIVKSL